MLYLNGGYIGDRFSPSNGWVGFMGGGPAVAMSLLWFSMLKRVGFNLKYVAYYLLARIAGLVYAVVALTEFTSINIQAILGHYF